ncbi:MaoC/PaaZ C-terminal domain-containing protein [Alicyclobacillus dauci]|uniref:MaoC/PaaZ C-terminal domain-containing protein n=1 Tax=Alicyclobacillus dauci TaxID=1475485 RepID=A0ABY6Z5C1_9BACL|nr:MaoC/PaaZ C-terminal domain-containing protein [Alicyclobacillus dauci]WAH37484.1 MaoC/PaaZ C-terminal domain-containing protein [Alicyclobacillus dauci]
MDQLNFQGVFVGEALPPLTKPAVEKVQLVKYAGASGDFNLIHTDDETARKVGLPGVIAHGMLSMGFLGQYARLLVGTNGYVRRLKVRFVGMVRPGDELTCRGTVVGKDVEAKTITLAVHTEREEGKLLTVGEAVLQYF